MAVKILVSGDIHIGRRSGAVDVNSPFGTTRYTWEKIIERAIGENADVLALTGDIVDRDNRFFEAVGPLQSGFEKLGEAGIEVFIVAGNHDFDVLAEVLDTYEYPHVHFLGRNEEWELQEYKKRNQQLTFVGWSFSRRHVHQDPLVTYDLPTLPVESPVIGLVHGDVDLPQSPYAPMSSTGFSNKGVDVWLLGHIHKPDVIQENPLVIYPGSPHALSPKEKGEHGPVLMTIHSKQNIEYEWIPLSPVQYDFLTVDVTDMEIGQLRGEVTRTMRRNAESLDLVHQKILRYDVELKGSHGNIRAVEKELERAGEMDYSMDGCSVGIRKIDFSGIKAKVDNLDELARQSSPVGMIAGVILAMEHEQENDFLHHLRKELRETYHSMKSRTTYTSLNDRDEKEEKEELLDGILMHQCHQLLSELLSQKQNV